MENQHFNGKTHYKWQLFNSYSDITRGYLSQFYIDLGWVSCWFQLPNLPSKQPMRTTSKSWHLCRVLRLPPDMAMPPGDFPWDRPTSCFLIYIYMGMDQYLLIPFLVGWTSIYQLFWCSPGVQGFDTLPYISDMYDTWTFNFISIDVL